ncbi:Sec-independent protein translocase subunit TatA [uncultured Actinomyces sp.]|uniref:Sec-independent protein translocase subunit TatA n=1 Tax=uncultured Actinomyces sp. TaxID=249061 RepID=UPI0028D2B2E5|nr:Sec-independent protein translocase subunit TatA [uncultured Actinomyces sp.]
MRFQVWHMIVLLVLVLIVFGSSKLPDIAKSVGQSMKVFKKEIKELRDDDSKEGQAQLQQQPQEGTYYTEPTQSGQAAQQNTEGSSQK